MGHTGSSGKQLHSYHGAIVDGNHWITARFGALAGRAMFECFPTEGSLIEPKGFICAQNGFSNGHQWTIFVVVVHLVSHKIGGAYAFEPASHIVH